MSTEIVLCPKCGKPEWAEEMRWCGDDKICRNCYKADWESRTGREYPWDNMDGYRPTRADYAKYVETHGMSMTDAAIPDFKQIVDERSVIVDGKLVIKMTGGKQ